MNHVFHLIFLWFYIAIRQLKQLEFPTSPLIFPAAPEW